MNTNNVIHLQIEDEEVVKQAEDALPNGTKVMKVRSEEGDLVDNGHEGTIIGSLKAPDKITIGSYKEIQYLYFVVWEGLPENSAAMVLGQNIQEIN